MNPMIAYDFNDGHFENILKKSQESHCSFIYFTEADMDLIHKLESIYKEEATSLRNVSTKQSRTDYRIRLWETDKDFIHWT